MHVIDISKVGLYFISRAYDSSIWHHLKFCFQNHYVRHGNGMLENCILQTFRTTFISVASVSQQQYRWDAAWIS